MDPVRNVEVRHRRRDRPSYRDAAEGAGLPPTVRQRLEERDVQLACSRSDLAKLLEDNALSQRGMMLYWERVVQLLEQDLDTATADNSRLLDDNRALEAEVGRLRQELREAGSRTKRQGRDLERAHGEHEAAAAEAGDLRARVAAGAQREAELRHEVSARSAEVDALSRRVEKLRDSKAVARDMKAEADRAAAETALLRQELADAGRRERQMGDVVGFNSRLRDDVAAAVAASQAVAACLQRCDWLGPCVQPVTDPDVPRGLFAFDEPRWQALKASLLDEIAKVPRGRPPFKPPSNLAPRQSPRRPAPARVLPQSKRTSPPRHCHRHDAPMSRCDACTALGTTGRPEAKEAGGATASSAAKALPAQPFRPRSLRSPRRLSPQPTPRPVVPTPTPGYPTSAPAPAPAPAPAAAPGPGDGPLEETVGSDLRGAPSAVRTIRQGDLVTQVKVWDEGEPGSRRGPAPAVHVYLHDE